MITSTTILCFVLKMLPRTHRTERVGGERLEILLEQQQLLQFLREERRMLWELHRVLLDRLSEADRIDWERASLDSVSVSAKRGPKDQSESDGRSETEQPKLRSWLRCIVGR